MIGSRPIDLRRQDSFVRQRHRDLLGVGDDMVIGDDQPGRIDDEPRTERGDARPGRARRGLFAEKFAEHLVERAPRRILRRLLRRRGRAGGVAWVETLTTTADEPRRQLREKIGEGRLGGRGGAGAAGAADASGCGAGRGAAAVPGSGGGGVARRGRVLL